MVPNAEVLILFAWCRLSFLNKSNTILIQNHNKYFDKNADVLIIFLRLDDFKSVINTLRYLQIKDCNNHSRYQQLKKWIEAEDFEPFKKLIEEKEKVSYSSALIEKLNDFLDMKIMQKKLEKKENTILELLEWADLLTYNLYVII